MGTEQQKLMGSTLEWDLDAKNTNCFLLHISKVFLFLKFCNYGYLGPQLYSGNSDFKTLLFYL